MKPTSYVIMEITNKSTLGVMNYSTDIFHTNGNQRKKSTLGVMKYQTDFFHHNGK